MRKKKLIYLGFIMPLLFWITLIICGLMTKNYNQLTDMVSELGRIGTKTQYIFTLSLVLISILSIFFIINLYKIAKQAGLNSIPILLILTFSFSISAAAIFPLPLSLHGILGSPSMLLPLSPLLTLFLWKEDLIPNIKIFCGIILIIMLMGFLTLTPQIMDNYFGLKQRFFHIGWSFWFIYLSIIFSDMEKNLKEKKTQQIN